MLWVLMSLVRAAGLGPPWGPLDVLGSMGFHGDFMKFGDCFPFSTLDMGNHGGATAKITLFDSGLPVSQTHGDLELW